MRDVVPETLDGVIVNTSEKARDRLSDKKS
jgi:hypothetical protein